jgi:hypothetical protein
MKNSDEKLKILQMLQDGKITSEDAFKLLEVLGEEGPAAKAGPMTVTASSNGKKKFLRIRVDAGDEGGHAKVNVNVPLQLAKKATSGIMKFIPNNVKDDLRREGIDLEELDIPGLIELFENGEFDDNLVDIEAGEDGGGATVKVYVD